MDKWKVRQQPPNVNKDVLYGIYAGETLLIPFVRNKPEAETICACVNAMTACAEPLGISPFDFAKRLESVPGFGMWVKFATDLVPDEDLEAEQKRYDLLVHGECFEVDGKRVDPERVTIRRAIVPKKFMRGKPPLEEVNDGELTTQERSARSAEGEDHTRQDPTQGQGPGERQ